MTNTFAALQEVADHGEVLYDPKFHDSLVSRGLLKHTPLGGGVSVTPAGEAALLDALLAAHQYVLSLPVRSEA